MPPAPKKPVTPWIPARPAAPRPVQVNITIRNGKRKETAGDTLIGAAGLCGWIILAGILLGLWKPELQAILILVIALLTAVSVICSLIALCCGAVLRALLYGIGIPALAALAVLFLWGFSHR